MLKNLFIPVFLSIIFSLSAANMSSHLALRGGGGHGGYEGGSARGSEFQQYDREAQLWKDNRQYWDGSNYSDPFAEPSYEQDQSAQDKFDQEFPVDDY